MSRGASARRRAAAYTSYGLGLGLPAPQPVATPKPRPKPAAVPARPAAVPVTTALVVAPPTPWGRVAAECPDRRSINTHEIATEHWTCSCGWTGARLSEHRCAGVVVVERRAWVHVQRADGGTVRCVPGRLEHVYRWDTLEWRGGLVRIANEKPRAPRFVPIDGLGYAERVTTAYSAAEDVGRRVCAVAPAVAERRACGCSPAGLCVAARALVEQIEERRALSGVDAETVRAVWERAFAMTSLVLRAHLAGVAATYASGRWWTQAIRA